MACNSVGLGSNLYYHNTPPQMNTRPIPFVCFRCFSCNNALVNTSAVCSGLRTLLTVTTLSHISSWIQCHQRSMCFDRLWYCGFLAMDREPSLSPFITVGKPSCNNPNSKYRFLSQHTLCAASVRVTYSASVDNKACNSWVLKFHIIAPSLARSTYLVINLHSSAFINVALAYA